MKNQNNRKQVKVISATLLESRMLKSLVERLAKRNYDADYFYEKVQEGSKAIETSSLEAYVSVEMALTENGDHFNIPIVTCFLFTCIKHSGGNYNLRLASSLS